MIFLTLILGAMGVPKVQAQITSCGDNLQLVSAADSCKTSSYNFDDPQPPSGSTIGGATVTYKFILSGATVDTLGTSEGVFNVGTTQIMAVQYVGATPTDTCYKYADVQDKQAPEIVCQNVTAYLDETINGGTVTLAMNVLDSASWDNCEIVSWELSQSTFVCNDVDASPITVTKTVTDASGRTDECTTEVTVMDTVPPTAVCKDTTIYLSDDAGAGSVTLTVDDYAALATDNCGIDSARFYEGGVLYEELTFDCSSVGDTMITLIVWDSSENTDTCSSLLVTVYLDANGNATITATGTPSDPLVKVIDDGSYDNCDIATMWLDRHTFDCNDLSVEGDTNRITVTLTVEDVNGLTATESAEVIVLDSIAPEAICTDVTVYLDSSGFATSEAYDLAGRSTDNADACGGLEYEIIDGYSGLWQCEDVVPEQHLVTVEVSDISGNSSTCTSIVEVVDEIAPVAECQPVTVYLDENGSATITDASLVNDGSTDNCEIDTMYLTNNTYDCSDLFILNPWNGNGEQVTNPPVYVTLNVKDVNGNSSTCEAHVMVVDTIDPGCRQLNPYS